MLPADERALREAIFSAPEEDGPRLAYADWLHERGDPWGLFMAAQLKKDQPTAEELFPSARHRAGGGLDRLGLTGLHDFERGFLVRPAPPVTSQLDLRDLDAWGAVEHLQFDPHRSETFVDAVSRAGHWRALKTAVADARTLAALARAEPHLTLAHVQVGEYAAGHAALFSLITPETRLHLEGPTMTFSIQREGRKTSVLLDGLGGQDQVVARALQDALRRLIARGAPVRLQIGHHQERLADAARKTLAGLGARVHESAWSPIG